VAVGQKHTPEQLAEWVELQRRGLTHERIAQQTGFTRKTVQAALANYNRRVMARLEKRAAAEKAKQVQQLEGIVEEALAAWERSKQDAMVLRETDVGGKRRLETTIKGQAGDPRFLGEASKALGEVRKILGLDAPVKVMTSAGDGRGPHTLDEDDPRFVADGGQPVVEGDQVEVAADGPADRGAGGDGQDVRDLAVDPLSGEGQPQSPGAAGEADAHEPE
jgi:uncharacterized protein (DUF433 family)